MRIGTKFYVADNSGAKVVKCIGILGNSIRRKIKIGDVIVVAVKLADPNSTKVNRKNKNKCIFRALVVASKCVISNDEFGYMTWFNSNRVILLTNDMKKRLIPLGDKVFGNISRRAMYPSSVSVHREVVNNVLSTAGGIY